jgi:hypothetical protein
MSQRRDAIDNILSLHRACPEAVTWSRQHRTLEDAWEALESPAWGLWALRTFKYGDERKLRLFAVACARRSLALWDDPQHARALDLATKLATGTAAEADRSAAYLATKKAAASIVDRPDYSEAMAAAATAAVAVLRARASDAAMEAARESSRAVAWDPDNPATWEEEGTWQMAELRRIVGADIPPLAADVRRANRGALHVL